ncbi:MAG: DUF58 domain-containing protein [Spirochaetaceae bacterium]|jgi:uncharacterized protein (DUF58 family)|nr:DUF58 domain-containing protein [Spirochaetaceae bacterium]
MKPGAGLFIAALLWLFLGAAAFFSPVLSLIWFLGGLSLLPLVIADGLVTRLLYGGFEVSREIPSSLALGEPCRVILRFRATAGGLLPLGVSLFDLYPDSMGCTVFPAPIQRKPLKNRGVLAFEYPLTPLDRGAWEFSGLELLYRSPLRFWSRKVFLPCVSRGRTYPDFTKLKQAAGKDLRGIRELSGRIPRRRGQGMEFLDLREYQPGDSVRAIDWRATGRRGKVVIREYQEEQDQQVLFILDSGYRLHRREAPIAPIGGFMPPEQGELSRPHRGLQAPRAGRIKGIPLPPSPSLPPKAGPHRGVPAPGGRPPGNERRPPSPSKAGVGFPGYCPPQGPETPIGGAPTQFDSALNAVLLLSYAALKHGDSVAALSFGAEERWLPPSKGPGALTALLNKLYDLKSAPVPSSPFSALENALSRIRRRTFIILVSNFREEDGESLSWILPRIQKQHLLLLVNLREKEAEELAFRRPRNREEFAERAAAFSYLRSRQRLSTTWEHLGLLTLETSSAAISPDLLNRYLLVKRSGRL